ncbi:MAG: HD-GYP domain-containing protein [Gemmatimonadales bacterium]
MTPESAFLISLGQTLATMSLYNERHPARERALDTSFDQLLGLTATSPCVEFSFLGGETVVGNRVLGELATWDWAEKLSLARIERIEIDADVSRESYVQFVEELFDQIAGRCVDSALTRQLVRPPIRYGLLKVREAGSGGGGAGGGGFGGGDGPGFGGGSGSGEGGGLDIPVHLTEEITAVRYIHEEVERSGAIPMAEVEAVVHSLSAAMHREEQMLVPLLVLKQYDQYTTTHACNVSVLAMGLAERLGLSPNEVRAIGVAGLLHDIGKVAIPHELLTKPGRYTDEERKIIQKHPIDGAKMILERERGLGLAAVVAYEHHIFLNGEGYPALRFPRACHYASRIVHVCDIYDALCTDRPYRQAWEPDQALAYLLEQSGRELDPDIVRAFTEMVTDALVKRLDMDQQSAGDAAGSPDGATAPAESAAEDPAVDSPAAASETQLPPGHLCNPSDGATVHPARES